MEINYHLSLQNFIDFINAATKNNSTNENVGTLLGYGIAAAILVDFVVGVAFGWITLSPLALLLNIAFRCLLAFGVLFALSKYFYWIGKRKMAEIENDANGLLCEHRIIISENELIEVTDVNTSYYSWTSVGEVTCVGNFVSIPINFSTVYPIPFSAFSDESHVKLFVETANYYRTSAANRFNPSHLAQFDSDRNSPQTLLEP